MRPALLITGVLMVLACTSREPARNLGTGESALAPVGGPAWTARVGGTGIDRVTAITLDSAGNAIVTGPTSTTFDAQPAIGAGDVFITKYAPSGTKLWTRVSGSAGSDSTYGIAVGSSDSLYISGYVRGVVDGQAVFGGADFWVSKLDSAGTPVWSRLLGSANSDVAQAIAVRDGAVYAAGFTGIKLSGSAAAGRNDVAIARFDENGALIWQKSFGSPLDDQASGVAIDASGNAFIVGTTAGTLPGATSLGGTDIFLAKYDPSGARTWLQQVGSSADDSAWGVTIGADGAVYVAGTTAGGMGGASTGDTDAVLLKFDATSGGVIWTKQLGGVAADEGTAVAADESAIYLSGRSFGQLPGANSGTPLNLFAAKYDLAGNLLTVREFAGGNNAAGIGTAVAAAGGRVVLGAGVATASFDGLPSLGGAQDGIVLSLCNGSNFACELAGDCAINRGGCSASQSCTPASAGSVLCGCASGYSGNVTCGEVNECLVNNGGCDAHATCANTAGSRTCTCSSGYYGDGFTCDVDVCATNNGGCDPKAACQNTGGGNRTCTCTPGYAPSGTACVDIDECLDGNGGCPAYQACTNLPGTRVCGCPAGTTDTGTACLASGPAWTARVGGTGIDRITAVALDSAGNAIVTGPTSTTFDGQPAIGTGDVFVTKYAPSGSKQWTRVTGSAGADTTYGVAVGSSDSLYISGYVRGPVDGQAVFGGADFWVSKLNAAGMPLWSRILGSASSDVAQAIAVRDGAVYAAGFTGIKLGSSIAAGRNDIALARFEENGTLSWQRSFGSTLDDQANGVVVDASGNAYLVGTTAGALPGATSLGGHDLFLAKFDPSGNRLWLRQAGTAADDFGNGITFGPDGALYVTGTTGGALGTLVGGTDAFVMKYDTNGTLLWTKQLGSLSADEGVAVASDPTGVYVTGRSLGHLPSSNAASPTNVFLAKFDFGGTLVTVREYAAVTGSGMGIAAANGRVLVGAYVTGTFDSLNTLGNTDGVLVSVCSGTGFNCQKSGVCSTSNGGCTSTQTCAPVDATTVSCGCAPGYSGITKCFEVNECATENGGCDALTTCTNTTGSRTCGACPAGYTGTGETGCTFSDLPPQISGVTLTSSDERPTLLSTFTCAADGITDPDGDALTTTYSWEVDGLPVLDANGPTLAGAFLKNQSVLCRVTVSDPWLTTTVASEPTMVFSALPTVGSASVNGQLACGSWTCEAVGVNDADGDDVVLDYRWLVDGVELAGATEATLAVGIITGGQSVTCAVRGEDGTIEDGVTILGEETVSSRVTSVDDAPLITSISLPAAPNIGDVLTCAISVSDDCTSPALTYGWTVNGAPVSASGATLSTTGLHRDDLIACTVSANDGRSITTRTSNTATLTNRAPQIASVSVTTPDARLTKLSTLTCNVNVTDADGDALTTTYSWAVNGVAATATSSTFAGGFLKGQTVTCSASVSDGAATVSATSPAVTVLSSLPTIASATINSTDVCLSMVCAQQGVADADGDTVVVTGHFKWFLNGVQLPNVTRALPIGAIGPGHAGETVYCTAQGADGTVENGVALLGPPTASAPIIGTQNPPSIGFETPPSTAHPGASLTCNFSVNDTCSLPVTRSYQWQLNGNDIPGATSQTFKTTGLVPGDRVRCVGTASDAYLSRTSPNQATTLTNAAPTVSAVTVTTPDTRPTRASTFTCNATASDSNGDTLTKTYAWLVNGQTVAGATSQTFAGGFSKGQTVACSVTAADAWTSTTGTSTAVTVLSALPTIASAAVTGTGNCLPQTCTVTGATDPDGDAVTTLSYRWLVNGVDQGITTDTLPAGRAQQGNTVQCGAKASDGTVEGGVTLYGPEKLSSVINSVDNPPQVAAIINPADAHAGDTLSCKATVQDACTSAVNVTLTWVVNGTPGTPQTTTNTLTATSTLSTTGMNPGAIIGCTAKGADANNNATVSAGPITLQTGDWTITGNLANGSSGYAVAVVDDVNGDGFREIAVGAPNSSVTGAGRAGALYLVKGRNDVSASSLAQVIDGTQGNYQPGEHGNFVLSTMVCNSTIIYPSPGCPLIRDVGNNIIADINGPEGAGLGFGLAYAGDLDGDGVGDLVASAPYDQVGDVWTGRTYVLSGNRLFGRPFDDATSGTGGFTFDGECGRRRGLDLKVTRETGSNGDLEGWRVVPIGDANGDGLADFAVSAPNSGDFDEGTVYVVFGRTDGQGIIASDLFRRGCNMERSQATGEASGSSGYAAYLPNQTITSSAPQRWGTNLAPAGDFNGDGYDDLLVPTPGLSGNNAAYVILGGAHPGPQPLRTFNAASEWEIYLGDFSISCSGSCVQHGMLGAGFPSGGGGDVNGDGYDDLAFDARDFDNNGILNVLYGRPSVTAAMSLMNVRSAGTQGFEVFGVAPNIGIDLDSGSGVVRIVGDINGDGFDDIALGVPTQGTPDSGAVIVVFGSATPPSNLSLTNLRAGVGGFTIEPGVTGQKFGYSLASGDIDGDGLTDLVVGAPGAVGTGSESNAGLTRVVFGRDFTHTAVTFKGGDSNDNYVGTSAAESLIGGRGNDTLKGNGGADVLYGGAGNDTLEVNDSTFRRVNGGAGEDTLVLGSGVSSLTLTGQQRRRLQEIERIQAQGQTITVSKLGLVAISNTSHKLSLLGTGTVTIPPSDHWRSAGRKTGTDGNTYLTFVDGQAQLWIATSLTTSIPPTVFDGPVNVAENLSAGMTVATLGATDPDGNDTSLSWQLLADDSGSFTLSSSGVLRVSNPAALDFELNEWPWDLTVRVTDQTGLSTVATFVVSVTDVPEPPVFQTSSPEWPVFEDSYGVLGNVTAVDPDLNDTIVYALSSDPAGLFLIDPATGNVALKDGSVFNAALASTYMITATATDTTGQVDSVNILIDVLRKNPLVRSAHVNFELRNWSIYGDQTSSSFPGFDVPGFGDPNYTNSCITQGANDSQYAEPWTARVFRGVGPSSLPVEFDARYLGQLCTKTTFEYDSGTFNATVPYDVTFSYPPQLHPGETFTFNSTATPSYTGAALWGASPGFSMQYGIEFKNFGMHLAVCDKTITGQCTTVVDRQGINGKFQGGFGMPTQKWTASPLSDPNQFGLALGSPVRTSTDGLTIPWNEYIFAAFDLLNLPSNKGSYEMTVLGTRMTLDYTLINVEVGMNIDSDWKFGLDVNGVTAHLTYENGATADFTVGTPVQLTVPTNGDVNHDGRVDVSIALSLNSSFHNTWHHTETGGYILSGGYGLFRAYDDFGGVLGKKQVGPAMDHGCVSTDPTNAGGPMKCLAAQFTTQYDFTPTGFSKPIIKGGLSLAQ